MKEIYTKYHLAAIAASFLILLSGCSAKITSGEVTDKTFTPEHTETRLVTVVHSNGKTTYTTVVPYVYHYPDTWRITIRNLDENGNELNETFRVTEDVYNSVDIEDEFVYDEDFEPNEPEYTRERRNK